MRTYFIAQGTLPNALWWHKWEGNPKKRAYICKYIADSLCCPVELTQYCKASIFQWKLIKPFKKYLLSGLLKSLLPVVLNHQRNSSQIAIICLDSLATAPSEQLTLGTLTESMWLGKIR